MKAMRFLITALILFAIQTGIQAQGVFVNQSGYLPDQQKHVFSIEGADSFYVIDVSSGSVVFRDTFVLTALKDPATGLNTRVGDFSSFTADGIYEIMSTNSDTSFHFMISDTVFENLYKASMKGFYYQRCGAALTQQNAGVYARSACHLNDGVYHTTTGESGSLVATGGWHDAGDFGKYIVNSGITVGTLLLAYEMFPSKFKYDNLNIPESGNSVPDILDEVRYELNWMLEMQDTSDGGVYFKVTPANFAGFIMPSADNSTRYVYQKSSTATGDFAAVMAMAGRIYAPFDTAFAAKCLEAAKKAWSYLSVNTSIVPTGGFKNPSGTYTGEYGDSNDSDERLWAAVELYETTGDALYHDYYKGHYSSGGVFTSTMGWPNVSDMAHISYLIGKQSGADASIESQLTNALKSYCSSLVGIASNDGLRVSILPSQYGWGSNSGVLNNAVLLIVGYTLTDSVSFYNTALDQLDYIMGCNRINMTFVTGIGTTSPMNPHHRTSYADGVVNPIPGLLVGGPDKYLDDAVLQANFTTTTPPARCYADNWQSYASNEIAINWNAPLVFVAGFMNESPATPVRESEVVLPEKFGLSQNFPNPFNPVTRIRYALPNDGYMSLKVFNILGQYVATLFSGYRRAGTYETAFDGTRLASGVYICRLDAGSVFLDRKMVLMK